MNSSDELRFRRVSRIGAFAWKCALGLALAAMVIVLPSRGGALSANSAKVPSSTFCITDSITGDNFEFSFPGGAYTFKHVGKNPVTLTGTGVTRSVGVVLLNDTKTDRNVAAGFIPGQGTGRATVSIKQSTGVFLTYTVNQTIPNAACGSMATGAR